jgi:hypothetical protein
MSQTPASDPSPATATDAGSRRQGASQRLPLAISILALVVAGCAGALSVWLAMLVRNFDIQRAFVSVSGPQVSATVEPGNKTLKSVDLAARLTNSGSTPTANLMLFMRCATSPEPVAEPWTLLVQEKVEKQPLAIGPHASATAQCAFSAAQIQQMSEGKLHGYVLGDITYHGRRDDSTLRRTQFSWRLSNVSVDPVSKNVTLTATGLGQHNCVDAECPLAIMTH